MSARVGAVAIAAAIGFGVAAASAAASPANDVPTFVGVRSFEYHFTLSRADISPGTTIIQLQNYGEDPHDLNIRAKSGGPTQKIDVLQPGDTGSVELRLKRGTRYRLWCDLLDHRARGMHATLHVRRK